MKRSGFWNLLARIHRDEQGASMVEWVLIIAAVVVPLMGALIIFGGEIKDWLTSQWGEVRNDPNAEYPG
jgi:Flp pilus assembly pilin Flp